MKDLSWKELDGAYYSKGDRQGNPAAFGNFTRSSMSVDQKRICSSPKVTEHGILFNMPRVFIG